MARALVDDVLPRMPIPDRLQPARVISWKAGLATLRAADEADPVPVDRRMGTQPVERRAEILQRDVLEDVRDSGEPEVRQCYDGITLLGDEFRVPFLAAASEPPSRMTPGRMVVGSGWKNRPTRPSSRVSISTRRP